MSLGDSQRLADLIDSVADGRPIDWDAIEGTPLDEGERRLLSMLRMVAGVADVHRSQIDAEEQPPAALPLDTPTTAAGDAAGHWGHFQLLRKLGEGSFGEVYHARDTWLEHSVAVKLLKQPVADRARFLHEARTLARVRHPNVVAIHGADQHDGRLGFWMEFIDGHTLAEVVEREGVRSASEAALIGQDLCRAMAAVHANNIVHRDIKAQNVIRQSGTGRVVLMDFGAGEAMDAERDGRRPRGTPLYLAPELFDGGPATRETDIYALGVLLFNMVTRSYPVFGTNVDELVRAHRRNARHHLGDMRPDLPDGFVHVVETMLAVDPAQRYHSAAAARKALEEVVAPSEPGATAVAAVQTVTWRERATRWTAGIALALVVVSTMGMVSTAAFNTALGRRGFTTESLLGASLGVGAQALVAPVVRLTVYAIAALLLAAAARVFCRIVPPVGRAASGVGTACRQFLERRDLHDPSLLLQVIAGVAALAFALIAFSHWQDATIFAMYVNTAPAERIAALQPANEPRYDVFQRLLELALLAYGLVAYVVYSSARRSGTRIPFTTTAYLVAVPIVALMLMRAMPYRVVYANEFRRIDYGTTRCYQIGETPGWVRLFCPDEQPPRVRDYREDDPALRDRNSTESVFTPREQARVFDATSP